MANIKSHLPGSPSWADLATSDGEGAKTFYMALLGWDAADMTAGENMIYTMYSKNGKMVAASFTEDPSQSRGAPPRWQVYFTVSDVDATTERAKGVGGNVLAGPMDVFDAGRMSVLSDPQGAVFMLWQPKAHIGSEIMNEPGSISWFELSTTDVKSASVFYESVLGCSISKDPNGPPELEYTFLSVGGETRAGIIKIQKEWGGIPPYWGIYLEVADISAGRAKVAELGGENPMDVIQIEPGKISIAKDPQGAYFYLFECSG